MLHRAFSPMGRSGIGCTSYNQSEEMTRQRAAVGECFVAVVDGRIVGTVTLQSSGRRSDCRWYRQPHVTSLHQFAVDPAYQGTGIGKGMLSHAMEWAREHHFEELALDTPLPAKHLIQFYEAQGFRQVELVQFSGRAYVSCVLSLALPMQHLSERRHHHPAPAAKQPLFGTMV